MIGPLSFVVVIVHMFFHGCISSCSMFLQVFLKAVVYLMGSGVSHKKSTAMNTTSSDKHLRDLLLEKTSEIQRLKSEIDR